MTSVDRALRISSFWMVLVVGLALGATGSVVATVVPLATCPDCRGSGIFLARETRQDHGVKSMTPVEVPCWGCSGKRRITLVRRWQWSPSSLSP
ncbi:MAG TPA: hypothetical protein VKW04_25555 [Planctomycetota bacterium]|nr:hypothetical protein [Planctomycetota bacterium]